MKILEKIFSFKNEIKNKRKYKVITLLGFKIKFRQKTYEFEQKIQKLSKKVEKQNLSLQNQKEKLAKQKESIAKQKESIAKQKEGIAKQKESIKNLNLKLKAVQNRTDFLYVKENYKEVLDKIKNKFKNGEKIKVVFLINECQKWTYQSLYEELEKSQYFEVQVLITLLTSVHDEKDHTRNNIEENYNFFKSKNMNVDYAYKNEEYVDLQEFSPDIIFYAQPWQIADIQKVVYVSHFALTMYSPYGYQTFNYENNYRPDFHKFLFTYFTENEYNISRYEKYMIANSKNCISYGYPKLDVYTKNYDIDLSKYWKEPDKLKIIYAPHHSFGKKVSTNIGTFPDNYDFILNLAKNHPETTWIYKPHPALKYTLTEKNDYMTSQEYDDYCKQWNIIGNIYNEGDYFDIFKSSDLMITDCASFLTEYLPSKKPLIRLSNRDCIKMNDYGEKIISEYYCTYSNEELENTFNMLIADKNDPKKEAREKLAEELFDYNEPSAAKMCNYILDLFRSEDD